MAVAAVDETQVEGLMTGSAIEVPTLVVDALDSRQMEVSVCNLPPGLLEEAAHDTVTECALHSVLRVSVIQAGPATDEALPDVFGRYRTLSDRIQFIPHFPFDPGVPYRATFDPRPWGRPGMTDVVTLEFALPRPHGEPPTVAHVFPSADCLPENVLRFYVSFTNPMQRGRSRAQIELVRSDGRSAPDVLYRAPVELWDPGMQCLTILLDPGRLKRGVGPNRELGPPLQVGEEYTLVIGSGMSDLSGRTLGKSVCKRFRVTEAVREHLAIESWELAPPHTGSLEPVVLAFPRPLDWALLSNAISVTTQGEAVEGRVAIDDCERHWRFTPVAPWSTGSYEVVIAADLEDVCGNHLTGAFDQPVRPNAAARAFEKSSLAFDLA